MKDTVSEKRLLQLHPKVRDLALSAYTDSVIQTPAGVHPFITQTYRSFEESDKIYQQGRTTPGSIVSYAKAGQSYHNYSLALDFVITVGGKFVWKEDANWMKVVEIFKSHGFEWGGDWKGKKRDAPHFQMIFGYNWRDLLAKYNAKDFIPGTKYINI